MKRPGFQKMLTAIEAGYISAVFVKDLSRLGRNYIEVGKLTEEFFPLHDIRLLSLIHIWWSRCPPKPLTPARALPRTATL